MKKQIMIPALLVITGILSSFHFAADTEEAEGYIVSTFSGNGESFQVDGPATKASYSGSLNHIVADKNGNFYVNDGGSLRKIAADGSVNTLFGQAIMDENLSPKEIPNYLYGNGYGIALASDNTLYLSRTNYTLVKVENESKATILAGYTDEAGVTDGTVAQSRFKDPTGVCLDKAGNLYVVDFGRVRKLSADRKTVTTVAGDQPGDFKTGAGKAARLPRYNYSVACDSKDNLYIGINDARASCIAKITPAGVVSVLAGDVQQIGETDGAGKAARFGIINAICCDAQDNIWVACTRTVRKVTPAGVVTTVAGDPKKFGRTDGNGKTALFRYLNGICADASGNIYVTDMENYNIRKISRQ